MRYEVIAVSGSFVGSAKTRHEAVAIARIHGLSEDRVYEVRKRDGWVMLSFAVLVVLAWGYAIFDLQAWQYDWPALAARPVLVLFFLLGLPMVATITLVKAIAAIRRGLHSESLNSDTSGGLS